MNSKYWSAMDTVFPDNTDNLAFSYFSQQAKKFSERANKLQNLHDSVNEKVSETNFIHYIKSELDPIVNEVEKLQQLLDFNPYHRYKLFLDEEFDCITSKSKQACNIFTKIPNDLNKGKTIDSKIYDAKSKVLESILSIKKVCCYITEIADEYDYRIH